MPLVVGIDGCPAGWVAVSNDSGRFAARLYPTLDEAWRDFAGASRIWLDMPVGLSETSARPVDSAARSCLKPVRHNSVFSAPVRALVTTEGMDYRQACALSRELRGKAISRQTWAILPKIREADTFLRVHPDARGVVAESHPEVVFSALNHGLPMPHNKKTAAGRAERLKVLRRYFEGLHPFVESFFATHLRRDCAADDLIDALVLAVGAAFPQYESIPDPFDVDSTGLPMRIVRPFFSPLRSERGRG